MTFLRRRLAVLAVPVVAGLVLAGCSDVPAPASGDRVRVVTVTDVYGSIVEAIGGDRVEVTPIVSGVAQDPHEYEASARDQLAVSEADLVVVNGGGFDDFMTRLIGASDTAAVVIDAVAVSGLAPATEAEHDDAEHDDHGHHHSEGFNEHVWYSLHAIEHVAEAIEAELVELDPEGAADIRDSAATFLGELAGLHDRVHDVADELGGGNVVSTETISGYLLADLGLTDVTPTAFRAAIEGGTGVGVALLEQVRASLRDGDIRMLAENIQSSGPEAERIRTAALDAGVPVVAFSETLPDGEDYLSWMTANVDSVAAALR